MGDIAVVVPTNRPERMAEFCNAWESEFNRPGVRLLAIVDGPERMPRLPGWVSQYTHHDVNKELALAETDCIGRWSGGIRNYGFLLAGRQESVEIIVSLDDDVAPVPGAGKESFLVHHRRVLSTPVSTDWHWSCGERMRGYPYTSCLPKAVPMVNFGLWTGVPDLDAVTQLRDGDAATRRWNAGMPPESQSVVVPPGQGWAMCIMNVAFRREAARYMWMPPLPPGFQRWDDMWGGLALKAIADSRGWPVTVGGPYVRHTRASDPHANLCREFLGYGVHEELAQWWLKEAAIFPRAWSAWMGWWWHIAKEYRTLSGVCDLAEKWLALWPKEVVA